MSRRPRPFEGIAAPARLTVRDFIYAAGRVSETTPTTVGARRGRASKGQIHLVIDADGGAMGLTADHLRDVFIEIFYRASSGSITSTLRQAMQHLNEVLLE